MSNGELLVTSSVKLAAAPTALVKLVQQHLVRLGYLTNNKEVDGIVGNRTLAAFKQFKADNYLAEPDTLGQTTFAKLLIAQPTKSKFLTEQDYKQIAAKFGIELAALKAVVAVETNGGGFMSDGRPKILFEAHWFDHYSKGMYRSKYPNISSSYWNPKLYFGGSREYARLELAKSLNKTVALLSASWGLGQVMGFNFRICGYATVEEFVEDMYISERLQLTAMCQFIESQNLIKHLQSKNWAAFAYRYNGESYQKNRYDVHLASAYRSFKAA